MGSFTLTRMFAHARARRGGERCRPVSADKPVPDVEDVTRTATGAIEDVVDPSLKLAPRREQRGRVEVALHRAFVAHP